ncbi:MAG TPA: cytochrome c oxidase subunit 3 [Candidatus Acidoferrales bacterium]|nr:cytochrome c oxidase subunit 3 [Candidatus Acidoferrales bacterium]
MATALLPPDLEEIELERPIFDDGTIGGPPPPQEPDDGPYNNPEGYRGRSVTPLSAYRVATTWVMVSVVMLFSTLTFLVKQRWATSEDWVSIALPNVLYVNTGILLASSLSLEFARRALLRNGSGKCARWLFLTLMLGFVFLAGQLVAWQQLVTRGLYLASNPGSFFIYLISGVHGFHLLGGVVVLTFIVIFFNRWKDKPKQETAVSVIALYWHFMDALWIYLLAMLFITVQK